jgi:hypothetical protein
MLTGRIARPGDPLSAPMRHASRAIGTGFAPGFAIASGMRVLISSSLIFLLAAVVALHAQIDTAGEMPRDHIRPFILDTVVIHARDVFEGAARIPIISDLLDPFHAVTKDRAIRREVFFDVGDTVAQVDVDELEQNMRNLAIFAEISLHVIPLKGEEENDYPRAVLYIDTRDAFTLLFSGDYSRAEDALSYSVGLKESNLFGLAKQFGVYASYTTLNDRGWRYGATYLNPNIWGSHVEIGGDFGIAKEEHSGSFGVGRPFFSDRTRYAFNAAMGYYHGNQTLLFHGPNAGEVVQPVDKIHQTAFGGWFSGGHTDENGSVFRSSISINYNHTIRDLLPGPGTRTAFENSVGVFGGISSRKRHYVKIVDADFEGEEHVPIGAMGSVTIGKISPVYGGLDNVVYIGGDARQAAQSGDLYGFASIESGTGLANQSAQFITERVRATGLWLVHPGAFAARFEQSNVWNWPRYLFLPLDNNNGLRGHSYLDHFGDNRMIFDLEYRLVPGLRIWIFDVGAAAFYDVGAVWDQSQKLAQTQFHSSSGVGLRIGNAKSTINKGLLRIDLAYNFDQKRFARLIIGTQESFDVFGTLDYRPPAPYVY